MNKKGFTIIELIVVVAIIAVLAAIVMVNVTSYLAKGKNASIKGNLSTIMTNAAVYYDTNNNYAALLSSAGYTVPEAAAEANNVTVTGAVGTTANPGTTYCSCSTLVGTTDTYCVDSTGYKKQTATICSTRCAAATGACTD